MEYCLYLMLQILIHSTPLRVPEMHNIPVTTLEWVAQTQQLAYADVPMILLGNKVDITRKRVIEYVHMDC